MCDNAAPLAGAGTDVRRCSDALGLLRAADRYAYTDCGSTAYCYLFYWGRANTYTQKKTLSVENLSRANSWSLSSCACPAGSCPAESLSSWPIPAVVYEPANSNRHAAYSQQKQVAPTILKALGLNSSTLKGVAAEGMQLASWVLMVAWMVLNV